MTALRNKVVALVSALVILMAVVVLPGCTKDKGTDANKAPTAAEKAGTTDTTK